MSKQNTRCHWRWAGILQCRLYALPTPQKRPSNLVHSVRRCLMMVRTFQLHQISKRQLIPLRAAEGRKSVNCRCQRIA